MFGEALGALGLLGTLPTGRQVTDDLHMGDLHRARTWRQFRQHVIGFQQVLFFREMPSSRSCDEFSERLQIFLFTLRDPELNAVYNAAADV